MCVCLSVSLHVCVYVCVHVRVEIVPLGLVVDQFRACSRSVHLVCQFFSVDVACSNRPDWPETKMRQCCVHVHIFDTHANCYRKSYVEYM